jgi:hypothetical protein
LFLILFLARGGRYQYEPASFVVQYGVPDGNGIDEDFPKQLVRITISLRKNVGRMTGAVLERDYFRALHE